MSKKSCRENTRCLSFVFDILDICYLFFSFVLLSLTNEKSEMFFEVDKIVIEAVSRRCSVKKSLLKISQNPSENTCVGASFLKEKLRHRRFSVKFATFLRTAFFHNTSGGYFC